MVPHFFTGIDPQPPSGGIPQIELSERTLENGMWLLGHHDPTSDAAVIDIRIAAGSMEDGDMPGLASFMGRMLSRGTENQRFAELNEELDSLGAAIGVGAGREHLDVTGKCLKEDAGRLIELMADIVLRPTFPQEEIERVRRAIAQRSQTGAE